MPEALSGTLLTPANPTAAAKPINPSFKALNPFFGEFLVFSTAFASCF